MGSFTENEQQILKEMKQIYTAFVQMKMTFFIGKKHFDTCTIGMSGNYKIAIEVGSTLLRIGSMLFGERK